MPCLSVRHAARRLVARTTPWFWPNVGLRTKMAVLVVIGIVSLVSLFAYLGTAAQSENTDRTLQKRVVLAQATASHVDYILAAIQDSLTDVAATGNWSDPAETDAALADAYRRLYFFATHVLLLDSAGRVIASRPAFTSPVNLGDFTSVAAALHGQPFAVSRYRRPLNGSFSAALAAAPLRDATGHITGALAIDVDLSSPNLSIFARPIGLGETGYMDLIDSGGVILASTRPERVGQESDHGQSLMGLIRDHRQTVSACHDCHTSTEQVSPVGQVLAFAPLDRAQWGVAIRQSEAEVFATPRLLQVRVFALMLISIAGALVLVYATTRNVISPIRELTAATRRIAAGDLTTPILVYGHDEIGELAHSFDAMRARLNTSIAETHALNRELDARVKDRTAELEKALEENAQLYAEVERKDKLHRELLYRTFSAQEEERKRISRELHDETCQLLTGLAYALDNAEADAPFETRTALEQIHTLADTALDGVHRIISDLRPSMLDHLGFIAALRWYAETRFEGLGIQFSVREIGDTQRLPAPIETALFRVVQEAINNIAQHSHAAHASFVFQFAVDCVEARIADDGDGFVPAQATPGETPLGMGLMGMEERMSAIGGAFRLRSSPGAGTVIRLHVPYTGDHS